MDEVRVDANNTQQQNPIASVRQHSEMRHGPGCFQVYQLPIFYFQILRHFLNPRLSAMLKTEVLRMNVAVLEPTTHERTRSSHSSEIYDP